MKNIIKKHAGIALGIIAFLLVLGTVGTMDLEAQERAEEFHREAKLAAREAARAKARELAAKESEPVRLTHPLYVYK